MNDIEKEARRRTTTWTWTEGQFRAILESAPDAMVMVNRDGTIILVNRQVERLFGFDREELVGTPVETLVPERFRRNHPEHCNAYFQNLHFRPMGESLTLHGRRKDGSEFPVEISLSPIRTAEGTFVAATVRDVSKHREAEELFRDLLESAPDAMVITDYHGRIAMVNAQTERIFGYDRGELVGREIEILVPARLRATHRQHREVFVASPQIRPMGENVELYGRRKDGAEFPVEISLSPIQTPRDRLISSAIRDVTERVAIVRRLRLERSKMADVGIVTSKLAHDLGNPLSGLMMIAQSTLNQIQTGADPESFVEPAETIVSTLKRMSIIIDEIRNFSGQRLKLQDVQLAELIEDAVRFWKPIAVAQGIEVIYESSCDLPTVKADEVKLQRVMDNLIKNSVEAISDGPGSVRIKTAVKKHTVLVQVADTGPGIPEDLDVFRSFETTKHDGQGLGLSIAREIINTHGGQILARKNEPSGALFEIRFPVEPTSPS